MSRVLFQELRIVRREQRRRIVANSEVCGMRHEPVGVLGAPLKIFMRTQLTGCACILLPLIVAPGCRDHSGQTANAATPAPAGTAETASAPARSPMGVAAVRTPRRVRPLAQQPAAKPAQAKGKDTLSAAVDSTTTTTVAPPTPPPLPAPAAPVVPAPSKLALALAHLPFGDRERLEYQVKYGFLGVGSAVLEVLGLDSVRGAPAVHATFTVKGGIRIYRVNDSYESWFDPQS